MFSDIIILAGGFGERLWPASKPDFPKQFMTIGGELSFLQQSIKRAVSLAPSGKIIIATRKDLLEQVCLQGKAIIDSNALSTDQRKKLKDDLCVIAEPEPKHTTAPVLLCSLFLKKTFPKTEHSILVLTSDHIIEPVKDFCSDAEKACKAAETGKFVCFAIPPTAAATGYGYIKTGEQMKDNPSVFKIEQFKEKPDQKTADEYFHSGNYWWNSGMFGFTASVLEQELERCTPEIPNAFLPVKNGSIPEISVRHGIQYVSDWPAMCEAYAMTPAVSLDIAVAEKTSKAYAVRASFEWDDVGSWDSFAEHCEENQGEAASVASANCFVYSDIPVALCGVKNLTVVIKNGKALIMKKGTSNLVRNVVKILREEEEEKQ